MWPSLQETTDLVTFTEEILNGKLYFLCSENITESFLIKMQCSAFVIKTTELFV